MNAKEQLDQFVIDARNAKQAALQGIRFIRAWLPANFKDDCPYANDDLLYVALTGHEDSIWATCLLSEYGYVIEAPDSNQILYTVKVPAQVLRDIDAAIAEKWAMEHREALQFVEDNYSVYEHDLAARLGEK